jgi:glutaredoxin
MSNPQLLSQLTELLRGSSQAHLLAFSSTKNEDPEWPLWYADHLQKPLGQALDTEFYKSQLIYCLMNADYEHEAFAPETDWEEFVAHQFMDHYAPSETAEADKLALYYSPTCGFCRRVMRAIDRLGLDVEMRNVIESNDRRDELIEARGRATVPVLWIQSPDGEERWMPESMDIIHYLEHMYGRKAT